MTNLHKFSCVKCRCIEHVNVGNNANILILYSSSQKTVTFQFRSIPSRWKQNGYSMHKNGNRMGDGDGQATERAVDYIPITASTKGRLKSLRKPKDALLYPSDHI